MSGRCHLPRRGSPGKVHSFHRDERGLLRGARGPVPLVSRRRPAGKQTILLPFFGDLGDTILVVPAVRALRERYPDARLILLAMPLTISILKRLGLIDEAIEADKHSFDRTSSLLNPQALWTVVRLIRKLRGA